MDRSFELKIDNAVLDYMRKKRKSNITLTISSTGGGCCPTFEVSEVSLVKPNRLDEFNIFKQNDVTLYISKNARVIRSTLHFILKKNLIGATIQVEGLSLKKRD
ncbi:hypothetical protein FXB42_00875 [Acetobacterium wieringae]|uniref:FeS cluster biogenesis domain-containing protein n=1 Tax=Acetobacterium wieringae TaxID=52694 RepID=A0A5D0WWS2_9FIRM|nr:CC/Se motif family (seleno)protein [Acetobacterium wieringae]TYC88198.1 hypothetical protein FXB42_00875 [Acetobacterium wieringae]